MVRCLTQQPGILIWWKHGAFMFIPSTKYFNALVTFDGGTENNMQQKCQSFVLREVPSC